MNYRATHIILVILFDQDSHKQLHENIILSIGIHRS